LDVLDAALAALPAIPEGTPLLVRVDGAGATHGFVETPACQTCPTSTSPSTAVRLELVVCAQALTTWAHRR
jgi:hypothetical protein